MATSDVARQDPSLSIATDSAHIRRMARSPDKKTAAAGGEQPFGARTRRSPLTDYLDAAEPLERKGFADLEALFAFLLTQIEARPLPGGKPGEFETVN